MLLPYLTRYEELAHWVDDVRARMDNQVHIGAMVETPIAALDIGNWFDRIDFIAGNYLQDELPGGFDAVWMSHILHGEGPKECRRILRKTVKARTGGGQVITKVDMATGTVLYSSPVMDGFTGDQRVFIGWAQSWRSMRREEALREMIATDPHSPPQYRVNGVVRNIPEFYEAFQVAENDALYLPPEERVKIW